VAGSLGTKRFRPKEQAEQLRREQHRGDRRLGDLTEQGGKVAKETGFLHMQTEHLGSWSTTITRPMPD